MHETQDDDSLNIVEIMSFSLRTIQVNVDHIIDDNESLMMHLTYYREVGTC